MVSTNNFIQHAIRGVKIKKKLNADTTIIKTKHFSGMILRNKDDQYCDRSVVFSTL